MKRPLRCAIAIIVIWTAWILPLRGQDRPKDITILVGKKIVLKSSSINPQ
jgi:hypothetical protein